MIFFNILGLAFMVPLAIGFMLSVGLAESLPRLSGLLLVLGSAGSVFIDFRYRWRRGNEGEDKIALIHPWRGGHVSFLPVWLISCVVVFMGLAIVVVGHPPGTPPPARSAAISPRPAPR